jgi:hypothetical protein
MKKMLSCAFVVCACSIAPAQIPSLAGIWQWQFSGTGTLTGPAYIANIQQDSAQFGSAELSGQFVFPGLFAGSVAAPVTGHASGNAGNPRRVVLTIYIQQNYGPVVEADGSGDIGIPGVPDVLTGSYGPAGSPVGVFSPTWTAKRLPTSPLLPPVVPTPVATVTNICSLRSLSGPYSFSGSGFLTDANGNSTLASNIGRIMADGAGNVTGTETFGVSGTVSKFVSFSGTYFVNPDCTGTLYILATPVAPPRSIDFVVAGGGNWQFMYTNDGSTLTGTAYRINTPTQ